MNKNMKKYIKNVISFVMCIVLAFSVFSGTVMISQNTIVAEAAANTSANAREVYRFLVCTMGLTPAAACGVMANINAESGFRTNVYGDNGTSYGLCQWHDTSLNSGRMTALFNFCNSHGYDVTSVEGQMRYLESELKSSGRQDTYRMLTTATNDLDGVYQAAYYWCIWFEVPADRYNKGKQRAATAQNDYWPVYGNITGINVDTVEPRCVTETSAILSGSVYKPKDVAVESCGIYFGTSESQMTKYVNNKYTASTNTYGISFDFYTSNGGANPTLDIQLVKNSTYFYLFYCVVGGVEYKGELKKFSTALKTESIAMGQKELDVALDYEQWYEHVSVKKENWSMNPVSLTYTVSPSNTTDKQIWSSSDTNVAIVADGKIYAKNEGTTVITVQSGDCKASCTVYVGRLKEPEIILRSKNQGTKQDKFVTGDTVQISPVNQSSVACCRVDVYKVNGNSETGMGSVFLSELSADSTDWWMKDSYDFKANEAGTYRVHLFIASQLVIKEKDFYFEVLPKDNSPIDATIAESGTQTTTGLGSLAGVSLSLDGYIILNYYVLPTDESIGSKMSMQFSVAGKIQTDSDYEIAVVGDKVAYKYECKLAATELTESITAKLVLNGKTKDVKTLSANDYCKTVLAGTNSNASYGKAAPVVKALMNYCGYAQVYFGKNTSKLANSGLYTGSEVDPVLANNFTGLSNPGNYFSAYINGAAMSTAAMNNGIAINGIQYSGASLTLDSGTGLNLYFVLPSNMSEKDLAGYVFSVDGVGSVSFVATTITAASVQEDVVGETADEVGEETEEEAVEEVATDEVAANEVVSTEYEVEEAIAEDIVEDIVEESEEDALAEDVAEESEEDVVAEDVTEESEEDAVTEDVAEESEEDAGNEDLAEESEEETTADDIADEATEGEITAEDIVDETSEDTAEDTATDIVVEEFVTEDSTVTAVVDNEKEIQYKINGNVLCISLTNIAADELGDIYSVRIKAPNNNNLLIKYSPIKYMADMQNTGNSNGIKLMRAMYLYYKAIEAYKG